MHPSLSAEDGVDESIQPRSTVAFLQFQITPHAAAATTRTRIEANAATPTDSLASQSTIDASSSSDYSSIAASSSAVASSSSASASSSSSSSSSSSAAASAACMRALVDRVDVSKTEKANIISIHVFMRIPPTVQIEDAALIPHAAEDERNTAAGASMTAVATPATNSNSNASAIVTGSSTSSLLPTPSSSLIPLMSYSWQVRRVDNESSLPSSTAAPPSSPSLLCFSLPSYNFAKDTYLAASSHLLHTYAAIFAAICPESVSAVSDDSLSELIEKAVERTYQLWVSRERTNSNLALISLLSSLRIAWDRASAFVDQEVGLSDLLCLTEHDLKSFLPKAGPRKRLTQWIIEERRRREEEAAEHTEADTETSCTPPLQTHDSAPESQLGSPAEVDVSISSSPMPHSPKSLLLSPSVDVDSLDHALDVSQSVAADADADANSSDEGDADHDADSSQRRLSSTVDSAEQTDAHTEQSEHEQEQEPETEVDEPQVTRIDESGLGEEEEDEDEEIDEDDDDEPITGPHSDNDSGGVNTQSGVTEASEMEQTEHSDHEQTEDNVTAESEEEEEEQSQHQQNSGSQRGEVEGNEESEDESEAGEVIRPIDQVTSPVTATPLLSMSPVVAASTIPSLPASSVPSLSAAISSLATSSSSSFSSSPASCLDDSFDSTPPLDDGSSILSRRQVIDEEEGHEDGYEGHDDSDDGTSTSLHRGVSNGKIVGEETKESVDRPRKSATVGSTKKSKRPVPSTSSHSMHSLPIAPNGR